MNTRTPIRMTSNDKFVNGDIGRYMQGVDKFEWYSGKRQKVIDAINKDGKTRVTKTDYINGQAIVEFEVINNPLPVLVIVALISGAIGLFIGLGDDTVSIFKLVVEKSAEVAKDVGKAAILPFSIIIAGGAAYLIATNPQALARAIKS
ncbi:MAG: hypothetical protein KCHDKBKB_02989 [Elusimicrobia bacterium]|nr:hypothetical protein [Elusimicrobiota bacterium]